MNTRHRTIPLLLTLALASMNLQAQQGQQDQQSQQGQQGQQSQQTQPGSEPQTTKTDPISKEAIQKAIEQGKPGEKHEVLKPLVGKFKVTSRSFMNQEQGAEPQTSTGTAQNDWILGGRFVQMQVNTSMEQQPFKGLGFMGYDKVRDEYTSVWMDNIGTGIARASGTYDVSSKLFTETGTFSCPVTGEAQRPFRAEWKIVDEDTITYTMYQPGQDGQQTKVLEVEYQRMMDT